MSRSFALLAVAVGLVVGAGHEVQSASAQVVPVVMTGVWAGTANVLVDWIEEPNITVTLFINAEGRVTGSVGDAILRNARFERNRGAFARFFNRKSDWVVVGQLEGALIRAEGLQRLQLRMPLTWVRDHFEGGFTAWNPTAHGRDDRAVSAIRLRLDRLW